MVYKLVFFQALTGPLNPEHLWISQLRGEVGWIKPIFFPQILIFFYFSVFSPAVPAFPQPFWCSATGGVKFQLVTSERRGNLEKKAFFTLTSHQYKHHWGKWSHSQFLCKGGKIKVWFLHVEAEINQHFPRPGAIKNGNKLLKRWRILHFLMILVQILGIHHSRFGGSAGALNTWKIRIYTEESRCFDIPNAVAEAANSICVRPRNWEIFKQEGNENMVGFVVLVQFMLGFCDKKQGKKPTQPQKNEDFWQKSCFRKDGRNQSNPTVLCHKINPKNAPLSIPQPQTP